MRRFLLFLTAYLPLTCCLAGQQVDRLEVPDEASRVKALMVVKEVFKSDYTAAKSTEQKLLLAKKLLELANTTTDKPAEAYVLFSLSKDISAQSGDAETAFAAAENMSRVFKTDPYQLKADVVSTAIAARKTPMARLELLPILDGLTDELLRDDRIDLAEHINSLALATAKAGRAAEHVKRLSVKSDALSKRQLAFAAVSNAMEKLARSPADPQANHDVGWYHCTIKGDWEKGIPMLALGNHPEVSVLAIESLNGKGNPADLGDGWWTLAGTLKEDQADTVRSYARHWYRIALPTATGFTKARVEKRLIRDYLWEFKTADSVNSFIPYNFVAGGINAKDIAPLVTYQPKYKALQLRQGSLIAPVEFATIRSARLSLMLAPGNEHGTTIAVGGLSMLLWTDKCAFRYCFNNDVRNPFKQTSPGLTPGMAHEVIVEEVDGMITVTIDGKQHYTVKGVLSGTITVVSRERNGILLLNAVSIRGDSDGTRLVKEPIPNNLY